MESNTKLSSKSVDLSQSGENSKYFNGDKYDGPDSGAAKSNQVSPHGGATEFSVSSPELTAEYDLNRILIDTTAPFESVKEAVSIFGGTVDWKARKAQTAERQKRTEQQLEKVRGQISRYKEQLEMAEQSKSQILKELESTKRLIEESKLNLEKAQTEESQAKQDSELVQLRAEEVEKGITPESSVAAKMQLMVAKARYAAATSNLKSVKEELETLQKKYVSLLVERDDAVMKADETVSECKEIEKDVEELAIELISTKEALESAHAAHLEAEEQRIGAAMAMERDLLTWDEELKRTEEDLSSLKKQIDSANEVKTKLTMASSLVIKLKAELASYMEPKVSQETEELEEVKRSIDKENEVVDGLKVAANSLKVELEKEQSELADLRQREGMALVTVASLETESENIKLEIASVRMREKEAREKTMDLSKKLEHASQEADEAKLGAELAREELKKALEEAEEAKTSAKTMETQLVATRKEIETTKASEELALSAIKASQVSESMRTVEEEDSPKVVTLTLEEYYELSKRAHEAEEEANSKVASAMSRVELAKETKLRSLNRLEDANRELVERKEALRIAIEKAKKAEEGKLGVEKELRKWRAEHEQRQKAGQDQKGSKRNPTSNSFYHKIRTEKVRFRQSLGLKDLEQIAYSPGLPWRLIVLKVDIGRRSSRSRWAHLHV